MTTEDAISHVEAGVEMGCDCPDCIVQRTLLAALARVTAERDRANQRVREMEDEPLEFRAFPDDASDRDVLLYVADCASRWAPGVRLLGNARARDVARACVNAAAKLGTAATGEVA